MKKKVYSPLVRLAFVLMLLLGTSMGARADEGVILKLKVGQEVAFAFSGKPCISTGEELGITMPDGTNVSYDYAEVSSIRFGTYTITGIEETTSAEGVDVSFRIDGGVLSVSGLPRGESVSLYNLSGQRLASKKQTATDSTLSISLPAHGVLVIRTSTGVSYRVMNP